MRLEQYPTGTSAGTIAAAADDFCLYAFLPDSSRIEEITTQQKWVEVMKPSLTASEKPDFFKIGNHAPLVARMFLNRVSAAPHAEVCRHPHDHGWESVTWQQVHDGVSHIAAALISPGIAREDRVALASSQLHKLLEHRAELSDVRSGWT